MGVPRHRIDSDIESANSLANWSFVGIFVPLAGWITGGMSLSKLNRYTPGTHDRLTFSNIRTKAWWGIVLSTVTAFSTIIFATYNYQAANQLEEQTRTQEQLRQLQSQTMQSNLDQCLAQAEQRYSDSFTSEAKSLGRTDNTLPSDSAQRWDKFLKEWKEDCYKRAAIQ